MNISSAENIRVDKYPFLRLIIDNKEALIGDFKWSILQLGYVKLLSRDPDVDWEELLPEIHIPPTDTHNELHLKGFTADPIIIEMAHEYWKAINELDGKKFQEGPVPIPNCT